jgi:hypothetical protein
MEAASAAVPAKAAAARAALMDLGVKTRDLVASLQTRARDEVDRRRTDTADRLESLAGALRSQDARKLARNRTYAIAGASSLALAAALGVGVAVGLMLSHQRKKRAERRALAQPETAPLKEVPPPAVEQGPLSAGMSH